MTPPLPKRMMTCAGCGSERVMRDAWAVWSYEKQEWELGNVFDAAFCEQCEGDCSINEKPADPNSSTESHEGAPQ